MLIRPLSLLLCLTSAFAAATPVGTSAALTYSTYLRDSFTPNAIATDSSGNIYLAGNAVVDASTFQTTALIVKLNPTATEYLYVRYLGGSLFDSASAIAVDSSGNAYVVGATASPDFPDSSGGAFGQPSTGINDKRSFVAKFDSRGVLVFSNLVGGSANSQAQAVAVNASGQVLVSGVSYTKGFPSTHGAYSISDTSNGHPYLLELDPTGTKLVFSATGIGGSALALDASGNIFVAGTTYLLDYPTTPGAYQTTFPAFLDTTPPNFGGYQGANQYVSKVDPTGSKLIFSTSLSGSYNTNNAGLAIDAQGNVYLTGFQGGKYPFTVTPPSVPNIDPAPGVIPSLPFLSKLDPTGSTLLFSVPTGGAGVQVDAKGNVYVGGMIGHLPGPVLGYHVGNNLPQVANIPAQCLPNAVIQKSAYVSQVDAHSGNVLRTEFIGGSSINLSSSALAGPAFWITGSTSFPDFPFSPNSLTLPYFQPGALTGAYLGAVDFTAPPPAAGAPQIACIADAASLILAGPAAPNQLLSIFGTNLGPQKGVIAGDYTTGVLAGVDVSFGSTPSPLLYVSSTQINFAVPATLSPAEANNMKVTVNGASTSPRQLPLTFANPSLFLANPPPVSNLGAFGLPSLALNSDGSLNSFSHPAPLGSVVSVFLNGASPASSLQLSSSYGWIVTGYQQANPFVVQVDLQVPSKLENNFGCPSNAPCTAEFQLFDIQTSLFGSSAPISGQGVGGTLFVTNSH